jgi:hypothetical protein
MEGTGSFRSVSLRIALFISDCSDALAFSEYLTDTFCSRVRLPIIIRRLTCSISLPNQGECSCTSRPILFGLEPDRLILFVAPEFGVAISFHFTVVASRSDDFRSNSP